MGVQFPSTRSLTSVRYCWRIQFLTPNPSAFHGRGEKMQILKPKKQFTNGIELWIEVCAFQCHKCCCCCCCCCENCTFSTELAGGCEGLIRRIDIFAWRKARLLPLKWHKCGGWLGYCHRCAIDCAAANFAFILSGRLIAVNDNTRFSKIILFPLPWCGHILRGGCCIVPEGATCCPYNKLFWKLKIIYCATK